MSLGTQVFALLLLVLAYILLKQNKIISNLVKKKKKKWNSYFICLDLQAQIQSHISILFSENVNRIISLRSRKFLDRKKNLCSVLPRYRSTASLGDQTVRQNTGGRSIVICFGGDYFQGNWPFCFTFTCSKVHLRNETHTCNQIKDHLL